MAAFCPLFSGSSGNSTYVKEQDTEILIDVGGSCKRIAEALDCAGGALERISAIFITHEHADHIMGLKVLLKRRRIPVFATSATLGYLAENDLVPAGSDLRSIEEGPVVVGSMRISSFYTPHDSACSVGFVVEAGAARIGVATDIGHYTAEIAAGLTGCDLVMIESNYDDALLACSRYPYPLKRRIKSDTGHLSNAACARAVSELAAAGTKRFILAHLSAENNVGKLAYQTTCGELTAQGLTEHVDFVLQVAGRNGPQGAVEL